LSPFLLALIPGIRSAWRDATDETRALALGGTTYLVVQVLLNPFSGGDFFYGSRITLEWLAAGFPLLLLCWTSWTSRSPQRRRIFMGLALASIAIHAIGAAGGPGWSWTGNDWLDFDPLVYVLAEPWRIVPALAAVAVTAAAIMFSRADQALPASPKGSAPEPPTTSSS
jgi:hypothetical protein